MKMWNRKGKIVGGMMGKIHDPICVTRKTEMEDQEAKFYEPGPKMDVLVLLGSLVKTDLSF